MPTRIPFHVALKKDNEYLSHCYSPARDWKEILFCNNRRIQWKWRVSVCLGLSFCVRLSVALCLWVSLCLCLSACWSEYICLCALMSVYVCVVICASLCPWIFLCKQACSQDFILTEAKWTRNNEWRAPNARTPHDYGVFGSVVSSLSVVWGGAPAAKEC